MSTAVKNEKALSKGDMIKELVASTGLERKQVVAVLDGITTIALKAMKRGSVFKIHGLVQLKRVNVPAKPARRGIDPFTRVERDFPAKPATVKVKASALKGAKDAALGR